MNKKVAIVLINYKDYAIRFLTPCRDSLRRQSYPADSTVVYIIDNASTLETETYLKDIYPEAHILTRSDGNYAAANNLGFQAALKDGCEYVVTVNMDTEMGVDWLKELVLALDNNPGVGIAQSKILLYPKNKTEERKLEEVDSKEVNSKEVDSKEVNSKNIAFKINSLGNIIHFLGFGFTSAYGEKDREINGYPEISGYASGCSFIIRREVLEALDVNNDGHYYNEEYYMYHDDLELSLKVKLAGYQIILAPQSQIFHKYEFTRSTKMIYYMERNRYLTLLSFYPGWFLAVISLPLLVMDIGMLFYSIINGWFQEEVKIYTYFFSTGNYDKILKEREKIKKLSRVSFLTLAKNFSGRIEFQEIANPVLNYFVNPALNLYWRLLKKII